MLEIDIRPTVANDLSRLMGFDHSVTSESVWQLELRREPGQVNASFREVRLPRSISIEYPHNPFALADDWVRKSMMYTGLVGQDPVGYISLLERGAASVVWVTDLVVNMAYRRQGVANALLAAAQDWAANRSHRRLILEMQSKNLPAIRLAQKFGYEFCGYNDHYYINQDVALFFAKALK
ncbi:MAG: GNAT family N-acetyltransferase [Anaerolineales bacterium]|nr:GNAT family N-acetyltransferase [Anaerolineales bacterium]